MFKKKKSKVTLRIYSDSDWIVDLAADQLGWGGGDGGGLHSFKRGGKTTNVKVSRQSPVDCGVEFQFSWD